MLLFVYDQQRGTLRSVATAFIQDASVIEPEDIPLPPKARRMLERGGGEQTQVIDRMGEHSVGRPVDISRPSSPFLPRTEPPGFSPVGA